MLLACSTPVQADSWYDIKGDHFIVFYKTDEPFARKTAHNAETYYERIANELGYARHSNFWQWEKRVKIYIYASLQEFQKDTGEPAWSHGVARYSSKEIHTFTGSEQFMQGLLPHEIAHLIFRDFVGMEGQIPLWLDEGVAQWQEPAKRAQARKYARYLIHRDKHYPIYDLTTTDVRTVKDEEKVHAFYMQSVSLVEYLVSTYGGNAFTVFCRELRDGKKFDEALRAAYPNSIEDLGDLDYKWRKYVMETPVPAS